MAAQNITLPVGRVVDGNLYTPQTQDAEGRPLVFKSGPNAGQPRQNYFFGVAIPKAPGQTHWAQKPATWDQEQAALGKQGNPYWGEVIWTLGNQAFPNIAQSPAFAWKIEDGDSQIPNKRGRKPSEREGWPGHWIIRLSGGYAPRIYKQEGNGFVQVQTPDYVKPGHFVEVAITVEGNGSQQQPGMYLNHSMVCHRAFGPEIVFGPDVNSAGFGMGALPPGATLTPPPSTIPLPAAVPPVSVPAMAPPAPPLGQAGFAPPPPLGAPAVPVGGPIPVTPNPQFLQVPPPQVQPAAPAGIPAIGAAATSATYPSNPAPVKQMTAAAQGTYEAYIQAGWSDVQLIQAGLMLA